MPASNNNKGKKNRQKKKSSSPEKGDLKSNNGKQKSSIVQSEKSSIAHKRGRLINPDTIKGSDDAGNFYGSHAQLVELQKYKKDHWYAVNKVYWDGGCGGKTDDECMVGDEGGEKDGDEGLAFLDRLLLYIEETNTRSKYQPKAGSSSRRVNAIDAGAGVGRVTKLVLLKRFDTVRLVEANPGWSKRSRVYLGRKRAGRCHFTCANLQDLDQKDFAMWGLQCGSSSSKNGGGGGRVDLIWLQWTLQYMTDVDAIHALQTLESGLVVGTGYLVIKENRPFGTARADRFQIDTPAESGRYDITRPDEHHRLLFQQAGLQVDMTEQGDETNTYALSGCVK